MGDVLKMENAFRRNQFTWLAYLLLAFYGYYLNIFGPITPYLKDELSLSYTVSSLHFTAFAAGILLAGLAGHALIRATGRWRALWIGACGMSLSALFLIGGKNPIMTITASFFMGAVGSLILAIVPSALSDQHGEQRAVALSEANVVASTVAAVAPLLVGWLAGLPGGWRLALGLAAAAPIGLFLLFRKATPPSEKTSDGNQPDADPPLPGKYWVFWAALVLSVSVEFCMIFWSADYLEHSFALSKPNAAQAVSLFLAGMILGRLSGSRLVQIFPTQKLVIASILVSAAGFAFYWLSRLAALGLAGLFITGLGVASLYPLILSLAIGAANGNTIKAGARATLASGKAILLLPLLLGRLADALGIRMAYGVVAILLASVFLIIQFAGKPSEVSWPAAG